MRSSGVPFTLALVLPHRGGGSGGGGNDEGGGSGADADALAVGVGDEVPARRVRVALARVEVAPFVEVKQKFTVLEGGW